MLGEQGRDALIHGCRIQQKHRFQSVTKQILISIGDSTLKVKKLTKAACLQNSEAHAR